MSHITRFSVAAAFLAVAIMFGGGGSPAPLSELVVQLAALIALCVWQLAPAATTSIGQFDRTLWMGAGLFVAIPLAQIIPLPPDIWHLLPGRETEHGALDLIGKADDWRPVTLAPYRTLASTLSLIPPVTMLYFTSRLSSSDRTRLIACVAAMALLSAVICVLQVASGNANWLRFYRFTHYGFATGFQANRNAGADVLLIGLLALAVFASLRRDLLQSWVRRSLVGAAALFMALSIVLTGSRAGTALIAVCIAFSLFVFRPRLRLSRRAVAGGFLSIAILAGLAIPLAGNAALQRTWARFSQTDDARPGLWEDTLVAIDQYWPVGSGMATFPIVFPAAERLEVVDASVPNRAHNDYLEYALEVGVVGIIMLIVFFAFIAIRIASIWRTSFMDTRALHASYAIGVITMLALHSLVDYPMRSMSLATLAACALGLIASRQGKTIMPRMTRSARTAVERTNP